MILKEQFLKTVFFHQGKAVGFRIDEVKLPNNKKATREFLDHPGAVGVIPILPNGHIVMVKQYRHPVRQLTWEIPAGKLDRGHRESVLACAKRELKEETGFSAKSFKKIISFWPTAAFANEVIHLFVATHLIGGKTNLDSDEFVTCFSVSLDQALKAIRSGRIRDSKTIIGLMAAKLYL